MLITHEMFAGFAPKAVCDAREQNEVGICLSCVSREEVDALVRKALAAGGTTYEEPKDYGSSYGHGFQDLDGHVWDLMWMDPAAAAPQA
ncbi:hypothetical protein EON77_13085 [bacterium]|nr:MAG: hypothetical protein EON77_13085 [bacterium]